MGTPRDFLKETNSVPLENDLDQRPLVRYRLLCANESRAFNDLSPTRHDDRSSAPTMPLFGCSKVDHVESKVFMVFSIGEKIEMQH
jgi:hypothetical protein